MHYVYLIRSLHHNWTYIGCTDNLRQRFKRHLNKEVRSTKYYAPFKLVYYEAYSSKIDARAREFKLKHHSQTKELLMYSIKNSIS
ncbi:MAG: GIY-YIG nuclease family protein [Patescibacteria group bacterium]